MKIQSIRSHEQTVSDTTDAVGLKTRMLIGPAEKANWFHMRHFEIAPGGRTPHHQHNYEHEIIVLKGKGVARSVQGDRPFKVGDIIYVPANEEHQFQNPHEGPCEIVCLIPAPKGSVVGVGAL